MIMTSGTRNTYVMSEAFPFPLMEPMEPELQLLDSELDLLTRRWW